MHAHVDHTHTTCGFFTCRSLRLARARAIEVRGGAFDRTIARNVGGEVISRRFVCTGSSLHGTRRGL